MPGQGSKSIWQSSTLTSLPAISALIVARSRALREDLENYAQPAWRNRRLSGMTGQFWDPPLNPDITCTLSFFVSYRYSRHSATIVL